MPVRFRQAVKEVALWEDVVKAMNGKPYRLVTIANIASSKIYESRLRGYFDEGYARRIYTATNGRLKLTPYATVQSSQQQQAAKEQNAEVNAGKS
jgi:hypothetical protein